MTDYYRTDETDLEARRRLEKRVFSLLKAVDEERRARSAVEEELRQTLERAVRLQESSCSLMNRLTETELLSVDLLERSNAGAKPACVALLAQRRGSVLARIRIPAPDRPLAIDGCAEPPGGRVDLGESIEEAARRELLEETNLRAESLTLLRAYDHPECAIFLFSAEVFDWTDLRHEENKQPWVWFSIGEIMQRAEPTALCNWLGGDSSLKVLF